MAISTDFDFYCPFLSDEDENITDLNLGDNNSQIEDVTENETMIKYSSDDDDIIILQRNMNIQPDTIDDYWYIIWELLECQICYKQVKPPVNFCALGHHICSECWEKISSCSLCRGEKSNFRCILLENILSEIPLPCINKAAGCLAILSPNDIDDHNQICVYRKYKCPLKDCTTKVVFDKFTVHMWEIHRKTPYIIETQTNELNELIANKLTLEMKNNFLAYFFLELSNDIIFFLHYKKENNRYYFWVSCVSTKIRSSNERFKLVLKGSNKFKAKSANGEILTVEDESIFENDNFLEVTENFFDNLESPNLTFKIKNFNLSSNFVKQEINLMK